MQHIEDFQGIILSGLQTLRSEIKSQRERLYFTPEMITSLPGSELYQVVAEDLSVNYLWVDLCICRLLASMSAGNYNAKQN